jgi:hypothetical protein
VLPPSEKARNGTSAPGEYGIRTLKTSMQMGISRNAFDVNEYLQAHTRDSQPAKAYFGADDGGWLDARTPLQPRLSLSPVFRRTGSHQTWERGQPDRRYIGMISGEDR